MSFYLEMKNVWKGLKWIFDVLGDMLCYVSSHVGGMQEIVWNEFLYMLTYTSTYMLCYAWLQHGYLQLEWIETIWGFKFFFFILSSLLNICLFGKCDYIYDQLL